jgi:hypothetical protein
MSRRAVVLCACLAVCATTARADNSTCANAILLVPDGATQTGDIAASPASGLRYFRFVAKASRSYAVMLENLVSPDQQGEIAVGSVTASCGGAPLTVNDSADLFEPIGLDTGAGVGAARVALKSPGDGVLFFAVNGHINASGASQFRVRVVETTLFSSLWSTATGFDTSYRLYNTTNASCSVTLSLRLDNDAAAAGGTSSVTFALPGNSTVTRLAGAADMGVTAGQAGHTVITHDCPPGALQVQAYLSQASTGRVIPVAVAPARQQR